MRNSLISSITTTLVTFRKNTRSPLNVEFSSGSPNFLVTNIDKEVGVTTLVWQVGERVMKYLKWNDGKRRRNSLFSWADTVSVKHVG